MKEKWGGWVIPLLSLALLIGILLGRAITGQAPLP